MAAPDDLSIWKIARVMHEAVRAWQKENGQDPSPPWSRAPQWMKAASYDAVVWRLKNPKAKASAQHDQWLAQKRQEGWKFGKVKDAAKKTHPMMIAYSQLPDFERRKDALVGAVVDSLTKAMR
jgi:RyR domain-containing protein